MSERRKRCRKSKQETRKDYCEYENSRSNTTELPKKSKFVPYFDHNYCKPDCQRYAWSNWETPDCSSLSNTSTIAQVTSSTSMELCIKVEVEEFDEETIKTSCSFPNKKGRPTKRWQMPEKIKKMEKFTKKDKLAKTIKMFKYNPENLFSVSEHIASTTNNYADKLLDIELRNQWGGALNTLDELQPHEAKIQAALESWQSWASTLKHVRQTPTFYQCHICNQAWWRLQQFREHIKIHNVDTLQVIMIEKVNESMIVACKIYDDVVVIKKQSPSISIDGDCFQCGKSFEEHNKLFECVKCSKSFFTCTLLRTHESYCVYRELKDSVTTKCTICGHMHRSIDALQKHMVAAHSVRSDIPAIMLSKLCSICQKRYHNHNSHSCVNSAKSASCNNCCRKFATKVLANAHMHRELNGEIICKLCHMIIPTKCLEMEHMVIEHTKNYQFAYKCTLCTNQRLLFLDERSIHVHRELWHHKKYDRRRTYYEMMLVPKTCIKENIEDASHSDIVNEVVRAHSVQNKNEDENCTTSVVQSNYELPQRIMISTDVDVTVDAIDIKQEQEFNEDGEVDYEQMLMKMFAVEEDSKEHTEDSKEHTECVRIKVEPEDNTEIIDQDENLQESLQIEYPINDINLMDQYMNTIETLQIENRDEETHVINPLESLQIVKVKSEPIDEIETLTIKLEPGINLDDVNENDIVIKNELNDFNALETEAFDDLVTRLNKIPKAEEIIYKSTGAQVYMKKKEASYVRKLYICKKCGYTSTKKKYTMHVKAACCLLPGTGTDGFRCSRCNTTYVSLKFYLFHFEMHGFSNGTCPVCERTFDSEPSKLLSHVQRHIKNSFISYRLLNKCMREESSRSKNHLKCQQCHALVGQDFMFCHWEQHFTNKEASSEGARPIKQEAPEVTVDFERMTALVRDKVLEPHSLNAALDHLQQVDLNVKDCVICQRVFTRRSDLKRHLVEHLLKDAHINKMKNKCFRCQLCAQGFPHPEQYKFHMREHAAMPMYKCELCNKTFSDSSNFAKHKKTHNVRVLVCDICNKKFHSRLALEKHITEHYTQPKLKCKQCPAQFVCQSSFKRHKYKVHGKLKFRCVLCEVSFQTLQQKWDHNWEVHKERKEKADCPLCHISFRKFHDVRAHVKEVHNSALGIVRKDSVQFYSITELCRNKPKEKLILCE